MKKVALIWPGGLDVRRVLPLAYAWLAANTPRDLAELRLFDLALGRPEPALLEKEIAAFAPDVIAVSCFAMNFPQALEAVRAARRAAPAAVTIAGGQHPSSWPEGVLAHSEFDFVIKGEGEEAFPAFLRELSSPSPRWESVPGLVSRNAEGLCRARTAVVEDLDSLSFPDFRFIRFGEYLSRGYRVYADRRHSAPVQTSRGCPYSCAFCCGPEISGNRLRHFSSGYVIRLIRHINAEFGVKWFNIIDDNFTMRPEKAKEFCRAASALDIPGLRFGTPNGVMAQHGDPELWDLMRAAGWDHFTVAPESGSARVLDLMGKKIDLGRLGETVSHMKRTGLPVCGFFILGFPGETRADLALTMEFVRKFDLAEVFAFQPLPGSPVFRRLLAEGRVKPDFIPDIDDFSRGELSYVHADLRGVNFYRLIFLARLGTALRHPVTALRHLRHLDPPAAVRALLRQVSGLLGLRSILF